MNRFRERTAMAIRRDTGRDGPENLGEVLGRLFVARGWGRRSERLALERAWEEAVGPEHAPHTRVASLRRGVLEVEVANAVLLQELAHYHKRRLLEQLRRRLPGTPVRDLRFRAGAPREPNDNPAPRARRGRDGE